MERLQLFQDPVLQRHMLIGLRCREEVEHIYLLMFGADSIDTTNTLHDPCGVPRKIIIYKCIGSMKVDTFGKHIGGDQDIVSIILLVSIFGIKAIFDI